MRPAELEAWVLAVIERAQASKHIEDSRVEAKGTAWPTDIPRTARQLAGHANAARGEQILWIVGLDEKTGSVVSVDRNELSTWYGQIQSRFDAGIAPGLDQSLVAPSDSESVMALLFTTDRPPYVVKSPDAGASIDREAPWREANRTRTATREELLKMLLPNLRLPTARVLQGSLGLQRADPNSFAWTLSLDVFLVPVDRERVVIPHDECWVRIAQAGTELWREPLHDMTEADGSPTVDRTLSELVLNGPGMARYFATHRVQAASYNREVPIQVTLYVRPTGSEHPMTVDAWLYLQPVAPDKAAAVWRSNQSQPWERHGQV